MDFQSSEQVGQRTTTLSVLLSGLVFLSACYAEVGGALYPSVIQETESSTGMVSADTGTGVSVTVKLGFYLDVPLAFARTGLGVGLALDGSGGEGVYTQGAKADVSAKAATLRGDLVLPFLPFSSSPRWHPRITAILGSTGEVGVRDNGTDEFVRTEAAEGTTLFLGATLGAYLDPGTFLVSAGYQSLDLTLPVNENDANSRGISSTARGLGLRVFYAWTPTGAWLPNTSSTSSSSSSCPGGGYVDKCDVDGHCRSQWVCP